MSRHSLLVMFMFFVTGVATDVFMVLRAECDKITRDTAERVRQHQRTGVSSGTEYSGMR